MMVTVSVFKLYESVISQAEHSQMMIRGPSLMKLLFINAFYKDFNLYIKKTGFHLTIYKILGIQNI